MNTQTLPETYKGYSKAELLDMLERITGGLAREGDYPIPMILTYQDFVMEYGLTPVARWAASLGKTREMETSPN